MQLLRNYIILNLENKDNSGTKRELDELGRLTILKEYREMLDIHYEDELFVWTYKNFIILIVIAKNVLLPEAIILLYAKCQRLLKLYLKQSAHRKEKEKAHSL